MDMLWGAPQSGAWGSFPKDCNFPPAGVQCGGTSQGGDGLWRIIFAMTMDKGQVDGISALGLAHMGDGVFELLVRSWLCGHGRTKVQNLHRGDGVLCVRPGSGPVCGASGAPPQPRGARRIPPGGGTPISTPFPSTPPPRNTPGPPAWSAFFGHLFLEGKTERINWLFVTVMEELYGI